MNASHKALEMAKKCALRTLLVLAVTAGGYDRALATPVTDTATTTAVGSVAAAVVALEATLIFWANNLVNAISGMGTGVASAIEVQIDASRQLGQAQWDAAYALHNAKLAADAVKDDPPTDEAYRALCQKTRGNQIAEYSRATSGSFRSRLTKGWEEDDRALEKGTGPDYARNTVAYRCGAGTNGAGGFMNPLDNPTDKSCLPTTGTKEEKESRYDADISVATILPDVNKEPLERASIDSLTGKLAPDPNDNAQILFMAGQSFCYNIAGPNARHPQGKELDPPDGKVKAATYAHCKAMKSAYVDQCFVQLMYVTRPNCKDTDPFVVKECAEHHKKCQDAVEEGVELPKSFGNCDKPDGEGLSAFQIDWLNKRKCMESKNYVVQRTTNSTAKDLALQSELCQISYTSWQNELLQKKSALLASIANVHNLRSCWTGME